MKLVVFGATGNVGRQVVAEALRRGHHVVGVVRDPAKVDSPDSRVKLVQGDATKADDVAAAVRGADAVVSAISPRPNPRGLPAPLLVDNVRALIAGLKKADVRRIIFVGGAGSLKAPNGAAIMDSPDFPPAYLGEAKEGRDALNVWRSEANGLDWTYLSPAAEIAPGERTGHYRTTDEQLVVDDKGKSFITFQDYAVALLDELEKPQHVGRRFGVAY
ncbi:MAG TPA: NAD(P)H-binding protein [Gemmatimonadaceae bacterium]